MYAYIIFRTLLYYFIFNSAESSFWFTFVWYLYETRCYQSVAELDAACPLGGWHGRPCHRAVAVHARVAKQHHSQLIVLTSSFQSPNSTPLHVA